MTIHKDSFESGDIAILQEKGLYIEVKVLEVIRKFGRIYYLIVPVLGYGSRRVQHLIKK